MKTRNATRDDLAWIVGVYNSTVPTRMVTADTEPVSEESRIGWFEEHHAKRPLWIVEDDHGSKLGWVSFQAFYGRPAYDATSEVSIYLDAAHRGKGYGKQLLALIMSRCGTLGIETLLGFIFEHNIPSQRLFLDAGFERWALLPDIAVLDGVKRSLTILGKRTDHNTESTK